MVGDRRSAQRVQSPWLPPQHRPPTQAPLAQSPSAAQRSPGAQRAQLPAPPQSTSVSTPLRASSSQETHSLPLHSPLEQSAATRQPEPSGQGPQPGPVPPQSTPVSLPFCWLSSQEKATQEPPLQLPL